MFQTLRNIFHLFQAIIANVYYGFPSKKLKVIGVTGTDGKTTTTSLIYHILKTAGFKTSMISSVYANIGGKIYETGLHTTTPSAFDIQKYLSLSVKNKDEFFVLETTSHALDQNRVWGVEYEISVISNITHEHLDYHKTYDNYLRTKAKLLQASKIAVINIDDQSYNSLKNILSQRKSYTYGIKKKADFELNSSIKNLKLTSFNQYNYLASYSVGTLLNIADNIILKAFNNFVLPPGRLEVVYNKDFQVIVDFAHTPYAIESLLKELSMKKKGGRIIHVFGSAGLRDKTKRPLMGQASGDYSDVAILTEEDHRIEDPQEICQEIAKGLIKSSFKQVKPEELSQSSKKNFSIIINREEAVKKAISIVKKGDIVVLTGKGHEKSLCRGKVEYPWDDKSAVLKEIQIKNIRI